MVSSSWLLLLLVAFSPALLALDPADVQTGVPPLAPYQIDEESMMDKQEMNKEPVVTSAPVVEPAGTVAPAKPVESAAAVKPVESHVEPVAPVTAAPAVSVSDPSYTRFSLEEDLAKEMMSTMMPDVHVHHEVSEPKPEPEPSHDHTEASATTTTTERQTFIMKITKSPMLSALANMSEPDMKVHEHPQGDQPMAEMPAIVKPTPNEPVLKPASVKPVESQKPMFEHHDNHDHEEMQNDAPAPEPSPEPTPEPEPAATSTSKPAVTTKRTTASGSASSQLVSSTTKTSSASSVTLSPLLVLATIVSGLVSLRLVC